MTASAEQIPIRCRLLGVPAPIREWRFHDVRKWRLDFAWPDHKVAVEYDGGIYASGRHTRGSGYDKDCDKFNAATVLGWRVLHVTAPMCKDGRLTGVVEAVGEMVND